MRQQCSTVESPATPAAVRTVSDRFEAGDLRFDDGARQIADVQTDNIVPATLDDRWFSRIARTLFPVKAGLLLHLMTGQDERSCHRYAAGERIPSATFLAKILRSDTGLVWLRRCMAGADASWWQDVEDALELLETVRSTQASQRRRV